MTSRLYQLGADWSARLRFKILEVCGNSKNTELAESYRCTGHHVACDWAGDGRPFGQCKRGFFRKLSRSADFTRSQMLRLSRTISMGISVPAGPQLHRLR
jgi:hypothetical protein